MSSVEPNKESLTFSERSSMDTNAIIAAMAVQNSAKLVTCDVQLNRVTELTVVDW